MALPQNWPLWSVSAPPFRVSCFLPADHRVDAVCTNFRSIPLLHVHNCNHNSTSCHSYVSWRPTYWGRVKCMHSCHSTNNIVGLMLYSFEVGHPSKCHWNMHLGDTTYFIWLLMWIHHFRVSKLEVNLIHETLSSQTFSWAKFSGLLWKHAVKSEFLNLNSDYSQN